MKKNIWVERLGLADLIALSVETLLSRASVRYDENRASRTASRLIAALQKRGLCRNFYPAGLIMNKKDTAGYALTYHMENDFDNCLNRFRDKYLKNEAPVFKSRVRMYIRTYITHTVPFMTMVESEPDFKDAGIKNMIYLQRNPMNSIIIPYYAERGYVIRRSVLPFECFIQYMKPCHRLYSIMLAKLSRGKAATNISDPRPSIWVECPPPFASDFTFWRNGVNKERFDIVYYLDRNDGYTIKEQADWIEKKGLKWVDLHFKSLVKLSGIGAREIVEMCRAFFSCPKGFPFWFRVFNFDFKMWYLLYKPVFRRFKVKVLIQHQDALWIHYAQLAAIEDAGGIMVGFHWFSMQFYSMTSLSHPPHVYFVWGKNMYDWMRKRGDFGHHILPSGLWLRPPKEDDNAIRLKDGLKFVMAIFDSSVDYSAFQSEWTLAEFYLRVLAILEKNSEWGGIIKSKNWSWSRSGS